VSFRSLSGIPRNLIFLFIAVSVGIILSGLLYYQADNQYLRTEKQNELAAIADLKVGQIVAWRRERMADAQIITGDRAVGWIIQLWLANPTDASLQRQVIDWMASIRPPAFYSGAFLLDPNGNLLLSAADQSRPPSSEDKDHAILAAHTRYPFLSDLATGGLVDGIHIDAVAPILDPSGSDAPAVAVLILTVDPHEYLYPLIQAWPGPSETAETLLVRREGDSVVYLNDLRYRKNTALSLRIPLSNDRLPAAFAARGNEGAIEGIDYRGESVLAATRAIPDSAWSLVAKVDRNEIFASMDANARRMTFVIAVMIAAAGAGIGFFWRQQRVEFYRQQFVTERERRLFAQRYENLAQYANDIILLYDSEGKIVDANERAVASYGYTREELLQHNIRDLTAADSQTRYTERIKIIEERNGLIFESMHVRRDGSSFPIEASTRLVQVDGSEYIQSIIRDISERKTAEEAQHRQYQYLAALQETTLELVSQLDLDHLLGNIVARAEQLVGTDSGFLDLVEPEKDRLVPHVGTGFMADSLKSSLKRGEGAAGKVWETRKPVVIDNYGAWPDRIKNFNFEAIGSMAVVPLLSGPNVLGMLGLGYDVASNRSFDPEAVDLLIQFARLAAIAIENARLYSNAQQELAERIRTQTRITRVSDLKRHLLSRGKLGAKLKLITNAILETFDADFARIWIIERGDLCDQGCPHAAVTEGRDVCRNRSRCLHQFASSARGEHVPGSHRRVPLGEYGIGRIALGEQTRFVTNDIANEPRVYDQAWAVSQGMVSFAGYRLVSGQDTPIGVLAFFRKTPIQPEEEKYLEELAHTASLVIQTGKAEEEVYRLNTELEQRVVERTAELERTNMELEAFSYSVSHDLRAPLRALDGFSRILQEEHASEIDGEAGRYLSLIRQNAQQMGHLIDDLLTFSRLSRHPLNRQPIDMAALVAKAGESLLHERAGRQINVTIGDLPACHGDPALLLQVWINLLSNAFKYTRKRADAQIIVGSTIMPAENHRDGDVVYFIKDNGAGFDMRYVAKLFGVFQRLHRAEEYDGTGVGLAIVQRIIQRHGGQVWAEGQVDQGATFYFTISDGQAARANEAAVAQ
jgi:PAS domain S-box-containing protein